MIVKRADGYHVTSELGKNLGGPYPTRKEAKKRLQQVEYFKHKGKTEMADNKQLGLRKGSFEVGSDRKDGSGDEYIRCKTMSQFVEFLEDSGWKDYDEWLDDTGVKFSEIKNKWFIVMHDRVYAADCKVYPMKESLSKFEQYLQENESSVEAPAEFKDVKCKKCGTYLSKNGLLQGAYDMRDFRRFDKTGFCPMCL